jgi:hypothetical protein
MSDFPAYNTRDALLIREATFSSNITPSLDLGEITERGVRLEEYELRIFSQELKVGALPASTSVTFKLDFSTDTSFSDAETYTCNRWKQTGSASGADAAEWRFRVPTQCPRYVRVGVTTAGSTGSDLSAAKYGFELMT